MIIKKYLSKNDYKAFKKYSKLQQSIYKLGLVAGLLYAYKYFDKGNKKRVKK
jgi:hypothetical protein